jgi:hypothetical protein
MIALPSASAGAIIMGPATGIRSLVAQRRRTIAAFPNSSARTDADETADTLGGVGCMTSVDLG